MSKIFFGLISVLSLQAGLAQNLSVAQYIEQNKDFAIREMKRMGIPAAITLAQGILETQNGNSDLVKKSNNHFGIKCKTSWTATGVSHDDDAPGECFRCYKCAEDSYRDHSNFLRGSERYAFLFKLDPTDYKGWAYGLRKAGYATNPRYPQILIKNIEDNNLEQYTLQAVDQVPVFDASKYTSDPEEKAFDDIIRDTEETTDNKASSSMSIVEVTNKQRINGADFIQAKKGTSLLAIATANNIKLSRLLEYNELKEDGLLESDQIIFLAQKAKEGEKEFYILQPGETLYEVAQKNGIRLQNLYSYNTSLNQATPVAGSKINLRPGNPNVMAINDKTSMPPAKMHEVQPKEGLYAISKKYGVSVTQIREWNNLPGDNLKVGQQLIISISK